MDAPWLFKMVSIALLFSLALVSFILAYRYIKLANHLLSVEMLFIGLSAFSGFVFTAFNITHFESSWHFFDVFSRLIGVTVIMAIGLLKVVNGFTFKTEQEILLILIGFLSAYAFMEFEPLINIQPFVFLFMGSMFIAILSYMAFLCFKRQLSKHGYQLVLVIIGFLFIGLINDFVPLPSGNVNPFFNELVISQLLQLWGYIVIYLAYRALGTNDVRYL